MSAANGLARISACIWGRSSTRKWLGWYIGVTVSLVVAVRENRTVGAPSKSFSTALVKAGGSKLFGARGLKPCIAASDASPTFRDKLEPSARPTSVRRARMHVGGLHERRRVYR